MNRINFSGVLTLATILILISTTLVAASFNCKRSTLTEVEHKICNNPRLSKADKQMSKAYFKLLEDLPKLEAQLLKQDQLEWLKERSYELLNCSEPDCKIRFYEIRIQQLEPIKQAGFSCEKAATETEKMVCNSRLLKHADGRMTKLYKSVRDELLKQDQRDWLKLRDFELRQSYCDIYCAWQLYKDRIEFLVRYKYILTPNNQ